MKNIELHQTDRCRNTVTLEEACMTHGVYRLHIDPESTYLMFGKPKHYIQLTWMGRTEFWLNTNCRDQSRVYLDESVSAVTLILPDRS